MRMATALLLVALGGAIGSVARYLVSLGAGRWLGAGFPYGTFLVNVAGCFFIGVVATIVAQKTVPYPDHIRLALAVGFLGGLTTFSTFALESDKLLSDGQWLLASVNIVGSVVAGLIALRVGVVLARMW
ncbi:MAG: fluoride efflux transporter CrcB [Candidatus Sumerlaeaceae bacterium]|nr:fluoride efflux transporter CrcB [Candidatus Sumerlaeaceae bacterium]